MSDDCSTKEQLELSESEKAAPAKEASALETETSVNSNGELPTTGGVVKEQLSNLRVYVLLVALCLSLFLVNIEVTIVSTSLVAITNDLGGFHQVGWLVSGYLVTYSSLIIIWAKVSDIFGRKSSMVGAVTVFTLFSAGCGGSKSMTSLITCRVFQGVGAAGCYSMAMVVFFEAVPPRWYGAGGGLLTSFIALATLSGPLIGGVISEKSTWRWIFLLNLPLGAVTIVLLLLTIPAGFPNHGQPDSRRPTPDTLRSKAPWKRLDLAGVMLLLVASMFLVTAILQGGDGQASWSSPMIIVLLILSGISWIAFVFWERYITKMQGQAVEPVFPWRFVYNRVWAGMLLTSFFCGLPFNIIVVNLPERFQNVNQSSAVQAGIRLLPYSLVGPIASMMTTILAGKKKIPFVYFLLVGSSLQLTGAGLLTAIPTTVTPSHSQYGFESIAGFGLGVTFGALMLGIPFAVEKKDLATATGAMIQIRMLGGAIGLAIASTMLNSYTTSHLSSFLTPVEIESISQTSSAMSSLPPVSQDATRRIFAEGFNLQMVLVAASTGIAILTSLLVWRRPHLVAA